jgi:hypothetical protein
MSKKKGHEGHMCSLIGCDGVEAVARLVADARFVCTVARRTRRRTSASLRRSSRT